MNAPAQPHGNLVIALSFLVALALTAVPLPDWALHWRPAWVAMVLIYWCLALPERIGIGIGWCLGLLLDVQQGTLLGQHALALAVVAFIALNFHQRIRVSSLARQAVAVCLILGVYLMLLLWVQIMLGLPPQHWTYWMPAVTSMLLWPWVFIIMRDLRRKYRVS